MDELAAEREGQSQDRLPVTWATRAISNFGVFVVAVPVIVATIRILAVSRGDPTIIVALTSTLDLRAVVFGSATAVLPSSIFGLVLLVAVVWRKNIMKRVPGEFKPQIVASYILIVIAISIFTPWPIIVMNAGVWALVLVAIWRVRRRDQDNQVRINPVAWIAATTLAAVLSMLGNSMWIPREVIETKSKAKLQVYVLKAEDGNLLTLQADTVKLARIKRDDILDRQVCAVDSWPNMWSLGVLLLGDDKKTPQCP